MASESLIGELKRRRVFRALVGYGLAAFAVLQIIEPVMHGLHWPDAVLSYVVVALAAGFPLVVTLAWAFDVRAGAIQRAPPSPGTLRGARLAFLLVGIGILAAAPGLIWNFFLRRSEHASVDRSIAVLPLASAGDEYGYFAQGIHDELLRQLASIPDLQVISRTSVLQYREGARNLREIGEALGVASILEGSVQRVGSRVRVEAKLIDARTDREMWAERYDRDVTDVLAIETAVAEEIVAALHAKLLPEQKERLERKPTQDPKAYDFYLRGLEYFHRPGWSSENLEIAAGLFRKAIDADPSFALARAQLALALLNRQWWRRDLPQAAVETARVEAERSLERSPDLPEGHLAMGYYHYYGRRDFTPALKEFDLARQGIPNEANAAIAFILRRLGKLDEAARTLEAAARLDPRSTAPLELARTQMYLRRYEQADRQLDRVLEFQPDMLTAAALRALVRAAWKGEMGPVEDVLRRARGKAGEAAIGAGLMFLLDLDPRDAVALADSLESGAVVGQTHTYPKAFLHAAAHAAAGESDLALREYFQALPALEAEVRRRPDNPYAHGLFARGLAALGRKEEALREAERAVGIMPISKDAVTGAFVAIERARAEALVGENDAAIRHIEKLLAIPSLLSPALLRIDPTWTPLHNDDRFRKLAGL